MRIALLLAFAFLVASAVVLWRSIRRGRLHDRKDPLQDATPEELRSMLAEVGRWRAKGGREGGGGREPYFELPTDRRPAHALDGSAREIQVVRGALEEIAEHLNARLAGTERPPRPRIRSKLRVLLWNVRREREGWDEEWN